MASPACIVVLCFALATVTFGAPNVDFANFEIAALKTGLENEPGHKVARSPVEDSGHQSHVPSGDQNPGHGSPGQGNQGSGSEGQGNQGSGSQGQGNQGSGSQGSGSQGQGNQGSGSQGQGNQGSGSQGQGNQGSGSQGQGNQGSGSQGQGNPGQGNQGQGNQGSGNQGQGNQGSGSQGQGNQGQGNQGQGNQGSGGQGQGNQGQGNQGQGNQGQGNQGNGNQGNGNQGNGNQGNGNQGNGNQPQPPQPHLVVYEFGTKSRYDEPISPVNAPPFKPNDSPSTTAKDFTANVKYTDPNNKKITYVRIEVFQTGDGSANIVEGGIGTNSVNVAIVAKGSYSYQHRAVFYNSPLEYNMVALGNSTAKDVVLARVKGAEQYSGKTKAVKVIKYPGTTDKLKDKKPTYVVVNSKQTSTKLAAAVTKGDLKKSKDPLEVTLTAEDTFEFDYEVVFYSSAARSQPLFFTAAVSMLVYLWSRVA